LQHKRINILFLIYQRIIISYINDIDLEVVVVDFIAWFIATTTDDSKYIVML